MRGMTTRASSSSSPLGSSSSSSSPLGSSSSASSADPNDYRKKMFMLMGGISSLILVWARSSNNSSSNKDKNCSIDEDHDDEKSLLGFFHDYFGGASKYNVVHCEDTRQPKWEPDEPSHEVIPTKWANETNPLKRSELGLPVTKENRIFAKHDHEFVVLYGNASKDTAAEVALRMGTSLGKLKLERFADGEINIQVLESLRGKKVFIVQSTSPPVNENLMELLLLISTCRRASAKSITAVMPYYGYARQDRKSQSRVPISAADVALMITAMGCDRVVVIDIHNAAISGFFPPHVPVNDLRVQSLGVNYIKQNITGIQKLAVVSPDAGGVERAKAFQARMMDAGFADVSLAMMVKQRKKPNEIARIDLIGDVDGADCIIVDDMVDTAGTLCEAANQLKQHGAKRVFAFATHGLLNGPAFERIEKSDLEFLMTTDTIERNRGLHLTNPKIIILPIGLWLAEGLRRIYQEENLSDLYDQPAK